MLTIFKYPVPAMDKFELELPEGAKILSFQTQRNNICIWALVNPDAQTVRRQFRLAGTGHSIYHQKSQLKFIGTTKLQDGDLIFHLFEINGVVNK